MLEIEVGGVRAVPGQLRHDLCDSRLVHPEPFHERILRRRAGHAGRRLDAAAGQKPGHGQNGATRGHVTEELSSFNHHDGPR